MKAISEQECAERSAAAMLANDAASHGLGMELDTIKPGYAELRMQVTKTMLNGHGTCHGGYLFTLGDSAFAVACNSYNQIAVASSASIEFLAPAYLDDELRAVADVQLQGRRTGVYDVTIFNQNDVRLALFRGRSYRLGKTLFTEADDSSS